MKPPGFKTLLDRLKPLARPMKTAIMLSSIGVALYLAVAWLRLSPGRSLLRSSASTLLSLLIAVYPIAWPRRYLVLRSRHGRSRGRDLEAAASAGWRRMPQGARCFLMCGAFLWGSGRDRGRNLALLDPSTARAAHEVCRTG